MAFKFQRLRTLCPKHTTKLLWSNALAPNKRQPNWFHRHRFQSIANHCGGCMHILQSMFSLFQVKTLDATRAFYCFLSIYEATWDARRFDFALKGISIPSFNYNYNNNNDDDDVDDDNSGINDVIFSILCIRFAAWFLSFDQFGSLTPHRGSSHQKSNHCWRWSAIIKTGYWLHTISYEWNIAMRDDHEMETRDDAFSQYFKLRRIRHPGVVSV